MTPTTFQNQNIKISRRIKLNFQGARNKAVDSSYKATVKSIQQAAEQAFGVQVANTYSDQATVATYLETDIWPTGYTYTRPVGDATYCVRSPVLRDVTSGNCTVCTGGVANYGAGTTYFCATNLQ